jgi:tetratricopeptide (TPR) repeat protein
MRDGGLVRAGRAVPEPARLRLFGRYVKVSLLDARTDRADAVEELHRLAAESLSAGYPDLSAKCLERAAQLAPRPGALYTELGSLLYGQGNFEAARDAFGRAHAAEPTDLEALRGLAKSYHSLGDYERATYFYVTLLAEDRSDFESTLNLGLAYHRQGRLDDAVEQLRLAAELGEEQHQALEYYAHLALGKALYDSVRFEEAESALEQAAEINPSISEPHFYLGLSREALGRRPEAAASYRSALEQDPNDAYAHLRLASLEAHQGHGDEAIEQGTHALRLFERYGLVEEQASAYGLIGWAHYLDREWEKAAAADRRALELAPSLTPVRLNLGLALLRLGRKDEAREEYERTLTGPLDHWDLEMHGIDDLEALLREDATVEGAAEMLDLLKAKRDELLSTLVPEAAATLSDART